MTCAIFNPAHVPEPEENRSYWRQARSLVFAIPLFKEEKVEYKGYCRCGVEGEVNSERYSEEARVYGRGCRFRRAGFAHEEETGEEGD